MKDNYMKEWFGRSDEDQFIIDVVDSLLAAGSPGPASPILGVGFALFVFAIMGYCAWHF